MSRNWTFELLFPFQNIVKKTKRVADLFYVFATQGVFFSNFIEAPFGRMKNNSILKRVIIKVINM